MVCHVTCDDGDVMLYLQGHITANAVVTDQGGKELACVNIDLHL